MICAIPQRLATVSEDNVGRQARILSKQTQSPFQNIKSLNR